MHQFLSFIKKYGLYLAMALIVGFWLWRYKTVQHIPFEKIIVTDLNGKSQPLLNTISKPCIVHFYATWCGPCMRELPELKKFATAHPELPLILLTDDDDERVEFVRNKMEGVATVFQVSSLKETGIYSIPVTYLIDNQGEVIFDQLGECPWNDTEFQNQLLKNTTNTP